MIVVTNTIQIKSGHADEVAERFMNPKSVQHAPGFVKMELLKTVGLEEHDELKVVTTWESREAFEAWKNSDAFKKAHARREGGAGNSGGPAAAGAHQGSGHPGSGAAGADPEKGLAAGAHPGSAHPAGAGGGAPQSVMLGAKLSIHEVLFHYPS